MLQRFNDLPAAYRGNVTQQAPFGLVPVRPAGFGAGGTCHSADSPLTALQRKDGPDLIRSEASVTCH